MFSLAYNLIKNDVELFFIEILLKKVRVNNVDFLTVKITSKKVRGSDVDFSTSEITSKKYVEMTWKLAEIWSSTYRCNILVESTSVRRGVPVGINALKYWCETDTLQ